jgi:polyhydroxybutyrate depolymerase
LKLLLAWALLLAALAGQAADRLGVGDHTRTLRLGSRTRTCVVHVPAGLEAGRPVPLVIALHGAAMNGPMMVGFSGLNATADEHRFIVAYPSGTGTGPFLTWNAGGFGGRAGTNRVDDVAFIRALIDDLGTVLNVDPKRVFACGMSNGGMMCYRLAAELADRVAAIAPVAGTVAIETSQPSRAVSVIHFHGTKDALVPFVMPENRRREWVRLKDVGESVRMWVAINGCRAEPRVEMLSGPGDEMKVTRRTYSEGRQGSEVVLVEIEGGGHTWPGMRPPVGFIGASATNISANLLMWEFFRKHPMP